jgi:hypothetical protein
MRRSLEKKTMKKDFCVMREMFIKAKLTFQERHQHCHDNGAKTRSVSQLVILHEECEIMFHFNEDGDILERS